MTLKNFLPDIGWPAGVAFRRDGCGGPAPTIAASFGVL